MSCYVSKVIDGGSLYYLYPQTLFQSEAGDEISYDLTYSSVSDSVAMNITLVYDKVVRLNAIKIKSDNVDIKGDLLRLYVEPDGKDWVHRYSLSAPSEQFFKLYDVNSNPQITFYTGDKEYLYGVKRSAWKKYAPLGSKVFEMLEVLKIQ